MKHFRIMAAGTVIILALLIAFFRPQKPQGPIFRAPGAEWEALTLASREKLTGVGGRTEGRLFLCGADGGLYTLDERLKVLDETHVDLHHQDLAMDPSGRPWVASSYGTLYFHDGQVWSRLSTGTAESLTRVDFAPDGAAWVGADGGALFRLQDQQIQPSPNRFGKRIRGILAVSKDEAYVSLEGGDLYHMTGGGEQALPLVGPSDKLGWLMVPGSHTGEFLLFGGGGIQQGTFGAFVPQSKPVTGDITGALGGSEGIWAVGPAGQILKASSLDWVLSTTGRQENLWAMGRGLGSIWACGDDGVLLRHVKGR